MHRATDFSKSRNWFLKKWNLFLKTAKLTFKNSESDIAETRNIVTKTTKQNSQNTETYFENSRNLFRIFAKPNSKNCEFYFGFRETDFEKSRNWFAFQNSARKESSFSLRISKLSFSFFRSSLDDGVMHALLGDSLLLLQLAYTSKNFPKKFLHEHVKSPLNQGEAVGERISTNVHVAQNKYSRYI